MSNPKQKDWADIKAEELAKYFDWDIPSEQYSCIAQAIREARNQGLEEAATWAQNRAHMMLKGGPHFHVPVYYYAAENIRALKSDKTNE